MLTVTDVAGLVKLLPGDNRVALKRLRSFLTDHPDLRFEHGVVVRPYDSPMPSPASLLPNEHSHPYCVSDIIEYGVAEHERVRVIVFEPNGDAPADQQLWYVLLEIVPLVLPEGKEESDHPLHKCTLFSHKHAESLVAGYAAHVAELDERARNAAETALSYAREHGVALSNGVAEQLRALVRRN